MRRGRGTSWVRHGWPVSAGTAALSLLVAATSLGQSPGSGGGFDGRTFAEVNLPAPAQDATISMGAQRAWAWREENTERLLLDRDVRVSIGSYIFRAGRAAVWIEPVRIDGRDADQVAAYFDRVSNPVGAVGLSQQGERLLVTAIVWRSEHTLRADVLTPERPTMPFVAEGEARLARFLDETVNPPEPAAAGVDRASRGPGR